MGNGKYNGELFLGWKPSETNTSAALLIFVLAIVPGFLIVFFRSLFRKGSLLPYPAGFFSYLTISTVYWSILLFLVIPLADMILNLLSRGQWENVDVPYKQTSLIFAIILPILIGVFVGHNAKQFTFHRLLVKLGLDPIHPIPSAWDSKFTDFSEEFVLVRLKDGTSFGGLVGTDSFVSSDSEERDIYIENIYIIDASNNWISTGRGVFVSGGEISTIEFIPLNYEGENDEQVQPIK